MNAEKKNSLCIISSRGFPGKISDTHPFNIIHFCSAQVVVFGAPKNANGIFFLLRATNSNKPKSTLITTQTDDFHKRCKWMR